MSFQQEDECRLRPLLPGAQTLEVLTAGQTGSRPGEAEQGLAVGDASQMVAAAAQAVGCGGHIGTIMSPCRVHPDRSDSPESRLSPHAMLDRPDRIEHASHGRYRVERELGRGGMAVVYLAQDRMREIPVAIKVLFPEIAPLLGAERFHREIDFLRRLHHPHIVPVLDSNENEVPLYFTMPYVPGESLRARIERGPLPIPEALGIAFQVGVAIDFAHGENILHRDIKPENILLAAEGATVCDFGVARAIEEAGGERISSSGMLIGTPAYMSPEQARGGVLDGRCDIYALGCVMYEMLTGEPVFSGHTSQALLARQIAQEPRPLRMLRPDLPAPVEQAVLSALVKDPGGRPASAGALFQGLVT